MNKLLVEDNIFLNHVESEIICQSKNLVIDNSKSNTIYLINQSVDSITINMESDSTINLNILNTINHSMEIIINQKENSEVKLKSFIVNDSNINTRIVNNLIGNNNTVILVKNISTSGYSKVLVDANVLENIENNNLIENIRGLTSGGEITFMPNIVCKSNEVIANHLASIGPVNRLDLKYLMCKGISEKLGRELLTDGFILSEMDEYIKEKYLNDGGE